ncbi:phosphoribosyl-AMP cyclohydrolase [Pseudomonas tohonis]|uniref:phosphoribosyl-AMP cyclohydrolase n=1 Tax=Pseudomonas tohonis TaxID=2725477 RepID=UPI00039869EC|nr:phosphoribosyl-AMP cyclohydrolase [Pseudomonas tohonis]EQM68311.1 hypothetical protein L682_18430 [Pseudomonas alcaligenes OT 69]MDN4147522.1 phosphoribosyl-AMP cyclohydrolase [Pseudomonas tohonis]
MSFWLQLERSPAGTARPLEEVMAAIPWNADGLIAAVAQQYDSGEVLMLAWMNPESLRLTLEEGRACYWSRSRRCLWRKGDTSGHVQRLVSAHLDCDGDALLLQVDQAGPACHTGRRSCFYNQLSDVGLRVMSSVPVPSAGGYP